MVLEQILERPVAGQVKILRRGEPLCVGILLLVGHPDEPPVVLNQPTAVAVAFKVLLLLRCGDRAVSGFLPIHGLLVNTLMFNGLLVNGSLVIGLPPDGTFSL